MELISTIITLFAYGVRVTGIVVCIWGMITFATGLGWIGGSSREAPVALNGALTFVGGIVIFYAADLLQKYLVPPSI